MFVTLTFHRRLQVILGAPLRAITTVAEETLSGVFWTLPCDARLREKPTGKRKTSLPCRSRSLLLASIDASQIQAKRSIPFPGASARDPQRHLQHALVVPRCHISYRREAHLCHLPISLSSRRRQGRYSCARFGTLDTCHQPSDTQRSGKDLLPE